MAKDIALIELSGGYSAVIDGDMEPFVRALGSWQFIKGYAQKNIKTPEAPNGQVTLQLHIFILELHGFQCPEGWTTDFINKDPLDLTIANLRYIPKGAKQHRYQLREDNSSGYKGVHLTPNGLYKAQIKADNGQTNLGEYETLEEAAVVYNQAALQVYGHLANLNQIEGQPAIDPLEAVVQAYRPEGVYSLYKALTFKD